LVEEQRTLDSSLQSSALDSIQIIPSSVASTPVVPTEFIFSDISTSLSATSEKSVPTTEVPFNHSYDATNFSIEEISDRDDVDIVNSSQRWLIYLHPVATLLAFSSYCVYFIYRIMVNYRYMKRGGKQNASWAFLVAEGLTIRTLSLSIFGLSETHYG
jgi:hypothetical protein